MKDAVITVRLPRATRRRIEELARREGRSLSQQVERLIEWAMVNEHRAPTRAGRRRLRSLSGVLREGRVPTLADFRKVRTLLSASIGQHGHTGR